MITLKVRSGARKAERRLPDEFPRAIKRPPPGFQGFSPAPTPDPVDTTHLVDHVRTGPGPEQVVVRPNPLEPKTVTGQEPEIETCALSKA